jgi:hypothetical protein
MRRQLAALGSPFKLREEQPQRFFFRAGYRASEAACVVLPGPISVVQRAADLKVVPAPLLARLLLATVWRSMRDGYRVHTFESRDH